MHVWRESMDRPFGRMLLATWEMMQQKQTGPQENDNQHDEMKWNQMTWNDMKWNEMKEWMNEWMNEWNKWMNDMTWHDMTWHDMKWNEWLNEINEINEMKWHDMTWNGMEWNGMEWINEWMNEWMKWMNEWNEWMNGWIHANIENMNACHNCRSTAQCSTLKVHWGALLRNKKQNYGNHPKPHHQNRGFRKLHFQIFCIPTSPFAASAFVVCCPRWMPCWACPWPRVAAPKPEGSCRAPRRRRRRRRSLGPRRARRGAAGCCWHCWSWRFQHGLGRNEKNWQKRDLGTGDVAVELE